VAQTYDDWEIIVVDDGSTDGTEELMQAKAAEDPRVRFLHRDHRPIGASACRNIGVTVARGDYVVFLDSDDLLAPSCLKNRVELMERSQELDFVVYLTQVFHFTPGDDPHLWNNFTPEDDLDRILRRDPPWHTSGPLWRKSSLGKIGPWDERALSAQDWEFHIRAIAAGLKYLKISEVDSFWRMTRLTSITYSWKTARRLCNRVRLFKRITATLRAQKLLTTRRQRILAAEYYDHAFILNEDKPLAYKFWAAARREKIVGDLAYFALLASDALFRLGRRINRWIVGRFLPELKLKKTHTVARPPR
jgi:glycosyltransferase involved in cell wall biosynthesis